MLFMTSYGLMSVRIDPVITNFRFLLVVMVTYLAVIKNSIKTLPFINAMKLVPVISSVAV